MAVRSLALLQQVKRTPFSLRHTWGLKPWEGQRTGISVEKGCLSFEGSIKKVYSQQQIYLGRLPKNLHVLALFGVHVLAQELEQFRQTGGAAGARETCRDAEEER